jgi:hypothetical protein
LIRALIGGTQPNTDWWTPVAQRYIKEVGSRGSSHEVHLSRHSPPTTLTDLEGRAVSDGKHLHRHCIALSSSLDFTASPIYTDRRCLVQNVTKESMTTSGSNSTAPPVPTDGLHTSPHPSSLSDLVELVLVLCSYPNGKRNPTDLLLYDPIGINNGINTSGLLLTLLFYSTYSLSIYRSCRVGFVISTNTGSFFSIFSCNSAHLRVDLFFVPQGTRST